MKLSSLTIENAKSFLQAQTLELKKDICILVGPNGGGKTNLLDILSWVLRKYFLKSYSLGDGKDEQGNTVKSWRENGRFAHEIQNNFEGIGRTQILTVSLMVTQQDIENINILHQQAKNVLDFQKKNYWNTTHPDPTTWDTTLFTENLKLNYTIQDGKLLVPNDQAHKLFLEYLNNFEILNAVCSQLELSQLSYPMIWLPTTRSVNKISGKIVLAEFQESVIKETVDATHADAIGQPFFLAIGRIATKYRAGFEQDKGDWQTAFFKDADIVNLTSILRELGYEWRIQSVNIMTNEYDILFTKQGKEFRLEDGSSGERELFLFIFSMYLLDLKNALVIIDEPELHLHPKWQKLLLQLFEKISEQTGNQFLMATHSPSFISPRSLPYVCRIYSKNKASVIVNQDEIDSVESRHLLKMVNSHNNERIFFSEKIILVEGVSDRIFFEALFEKLKLKGVDSNSYDVVDVGGKGMFDAYADLLKKCKIEFSIIGDLDYVLEQKNSHIADLFEVAHKKIDTDVLRNGKSEDRKTLSEQLDAGIAAKDFSGVEALWKSIKIRRSALKPNLSTDEKQRLEKFIRDKRSQHIFILSAGSLEHYLPEGYFAKDVNKLILLTEEDKMLEMLPPQALSELKGIANEIFGVNDVPVAAVANSSE